MDLDEVAHHDPPHQDQRCLQIQLFSSLTVKELRHQQNKLQNVRQQNIKYVSFKEFKHKRQTKQIHVRRPIINLDLPCLQIQRFSFYIIKRSNVTGLQ